VHKDTHRFDRWSVHDTSSHCAHTKPIVYAGS
jgi:hypothetical protein